MNSDSFARVNLGFFPTPIEPLLRVGAALGIALSIKRDDYCGFGGGGNKVRKLEFLMADAAAQNADVVITTGAAQSNHARITAAAARRFGMQPVLVLRGDPPHDYQGNLLLDQLFGATLHFIPSHATNEQVDDAMTSVEAALRLAGKRPYVIPLGGATPLGSLGYVRAVEEMAAQLSAAGSPAPDVIVVPIGSGGTLAGLHVGVRRYWPKTQVVGVSTSRPVAYLQERVAAMAAECADLLQWDMTFAPPDIQVDDQHIGPGYGKCSAGGITAIRTLARSEGILLDPVYTGKAMDALFSLTKSGAIQAGARVLFIHCGGTPALYSVNDELAEQQV